ncbi:cellulose synthase operon protein YhjQ/BcsQ [Thiomicrorhabdus sp.]|uniref:cellulose synthase operon protein YhjQ/BcsQ n=1 Tax=Thiomicrorhabdus sp. TaxID=2039724 RepID=UPI0029C68083|nr:cellulose synthase operon protein YhjQ/BcsQ [Thiomicrorhabdus sp.]
MNRIITLQGVYDGSGVSAIASALGNELSSSLDLSVALIDLRPNNRLSTYFSKETTTKGISRVYFENETLEKQFTALTANLTLLSLGSSSENTLEEYEAFWLSRWWESLIPSLLQPFDLVILCLPNFHSLKCRSIKRALDELKLNTFEILVLEPTTNCAYQVSLHTPRLMQKHWLVNRFNPKVSIQSDIFLIWQSLYPKQLIPVKLYHDSLLLEAHGKRHSITEYRPDSLTSQNIRNLVAWLKNQ